MTRRRRRRGPRPSRVRRSFDELERVAVGLLRVLPPEQQLACTRGCAHCCAQRVSVTPLEVFELAGALRRDHDAGELAAMIERIREAATEVRGLSASQQRGHRCPLNQPDGSCVAYDSRPLMCRGANSFDANACARPGAGIPTYAQLAEAAQLAQERLDADSRRISGRAQMLELSCALSIVLEDPEAEARWQAGEPVFRDAAHAWFEDGVLRHWSRTDNIG